MDSLNEKGGELGEVKASLSSSPGEREQWLDTMADLSASCDRRYNSLSDRIARVEQKTKFAIPEEMRGFLLMLGLYVGVQLLLPVVIEMVERWRERSRS